MRASRPFSLVSVVAIGPLTVGSIGVFSAERGEVILASQILWTGLPIPHIHLPGGYIGDQAVAVFPDELDVIVCPPNCVIDRLTLIVDPAADILLLTKWGEGEDRVLDVVLGQRKARHSGCENMELLGSTRRTDGSQKEFTTNTL